MKYNTVANVSVNHEDHIVIHTLEDWLRKGYRWFDGYLVSPLKVLHSAAGYYLGHDYVAEEVDIHTLWPWSRESGYFRSEEEAEAELKLWLDE